MNSAILYIRVSTEEQANKGYSLRNQEDVLRQYCYLKNITILKIFTEDYSAKTFNRPAWKKLVLEIERNNKALPDLILFTKWDRFSRNTGDSYSMIRTLQKLSVEPQAIEQPLDLSVPENKLMLAFYLAVPEVENDRRGLNVKYGMHKAREEGRWLGRAPLGYANQCSLDGDKYIAPKEPEASIIKYAFEQLAAARLNTNQAYLQAVQHGLKCSSSNFSALIHNPVYVGNIRMSSLDMLNKYVVPGQHQGIVSSAIFEKVQELTSRKKGENYKKSYNPEFLLKGFINCPRCLKRLTASGSLGRYKKYYYYHCTSSCGFRMRTEYANNIFFSKIKGLSPTGMYVELYRRILTDASEIETQELLLKHKKALKGIEQFSDRLLKLKSLLLDAHIDFEDYRRTKIDIEEKIELLGNSIAQYQSYQMRTIEKTNVAMSEFCNLYTFFSGLNKEFQREFVFNLCVSGWQWNEDCFDSIFKEGVHVVYGLPGKEGVEGFENRSDESLSYLRNLAKMELVKRH